MSDQNISFVSAPVVVHFGATPPHVAPLTPKAPGKYVQPLSQKCELTAEEVKAIYNTFKKFNDVSMNNPGHPKGNVGPLARELKKVNWLDCTEWTVKGKCTNPTCEDGLHA
jgi:hypothetical protein